MNEKEIISLRAVYSKRNRARYISHLDVTRCMQRAVKRAGLPVWYTEGFNPHIYLTFALPLSLGYESRCETMDFRLTAPFPLEEARARLNAALPPDIQIEGLAPPVHKPDAITAARYQISLTGSGLEGAALAEGFRQFFSAEEIRVEKHSKKGVREVNIKPDCTLLELEAVSGGLALELQTAAGPVHNVNPTLLTDAFLRSQNLGPESVLTRVFRTDILMSDDRSFC